MAAVFGFHAESVGVKRWGVPVPGTFDFCGVLLVVASVSTRLLYNRAGRLSQGMSATVLADRGMRRGLAVADSTMW